MKILLRTFLLLGYCIPYVFLAMNEDAVTGTPYFYFVIILCFGVLCCLSIKTKNKSIVVYGNILSFISSCFFAWFFQTEKWEWYFKPFLPNQLIVFETLIAFMIQMIFVIKNRRQKDE